MTNFDTKDLTAIRAGIDDVDRQILQLLGKRQALVQQVIPIKLKGHLPARIPGRVLQVIEGAVALAPLHGVDPDLARTVWSAMVEWFVAHEEAALKSAAHN